MFSYVDTTGLAQIKSALRPSTRLVWLETPSNPLLNMTDIQAVAHLIPSPLVGGDNTFATPYLQRPLELGADLVVNSTTKYLGGHSDVIGGAVVIRDPNLQEQLAFFQNAVGSVPGPVDCFLVLRGLKPLPVRMDRHAENASEVARYLGEHPFIECVLYPFQPSHPQANLARQQMRNGGGMISFIVKGGADSAKRVVEKTKIFTLAESLGGVESLIEVPCAMTHVSTADLPLAVDPGLVRLSDDLEHVDDLILDLDQAFSQAT